MRSDGDKKVSRIFQAGLGLCLLVIAGVGSINTVAYNTRGIKTQAEVLELVLDQGYRSRPWPHSVDYYKVRVQFVDAQGVRQERWARIKPADREKFNVAVGFQTPLIYIPGDARCLIDTGLPGWKWLIAGNAVCVPLGLLLLGLAMAGRYPGWRD